jgi:putative transposase
MPYDPAIHHRQSIRLKGYDYSQPGAYFVTIVTHGRDSFLSSVVDRDVRLSRYGQVAAREWLGLPHHYPHIELDEFCIMPDHVHGIIVICTGGSGSSYALPEIVRGFKTYSARRINELRQTPGIHVWHRNYYEHVIRDSADLDRIRHYILENPIRWEPPA